IQVIAHGLWVVDPDIAVKRYRFAGKSFLSKPLQSFLFVESIVEQGHRSSKGELYCRRKALFLQRIFGECENYDFCFFTVLGISHMLAVACPNFRWNIKNRLLLTCFKRRNFFVSPKTWKLITLKSEMTFRSFLLVKNPLKSFSACERPSMRFRCHCGPGFFRW